MSILQIVASLSNENLTTTISGCNSNNRLYRIPSLPKSRSKSGIPVPTVQRDLSSIALRGQIDI